ncbi:hypothetical protein SVAN01_11027 [Stagonosporopsis vannaccii]|nr:hypothetical protein SVAN01_11027 [Stagonosporopsis vannaccii]
MVLRFSFLALCLVPVSTAIRFQGRVSANHTAAPYSNSTSKAESSISIAATAAQIRPQSHHYLAAETAYSTGYSAARPVETGWIDPYDEALYNSSSNNATCTVHIPDAEIKWWFPVTYSLPIATITREWGNYSHSRSYTFVPHTTSFNVASALQTEVLCTSGWTTYTEWNWTAYECIPYTERPTAASTALAYRSAVPPIPTGNEMPQNDVWMYDIMFDDMPSPTLEVSVAPNSTVVETMPTPFVHVTAYEVERGNSTETVHLGSVYLQPYWKKGIEHDAAATGPIPDGFMEQIPQTSCVAGSLQAVVTVIVFVEMYYAHFAWFQPGIVHWESSALGWDDDFVQGLVDPTLSNLLPQIKTDWNFPGLTTEPAKPGATGVRTPAAPAEPGVVIVANKATKPAPVHTVGTIGTVPVVVGPSSIVVVGSQTLRPGGPAVTVGGTPVTLAPSATAIVVGGTSLSLPQIQRPGQQQTVGTLGTIPVVVGPSSAVVVGSQTLQPGGPAITLGPGTTVSLAPSATALVVGGTTSDLPQVVNQKPLEVTPPVLTIGSSTFVPNAATQFFLGPGQTLIPGGTAIMDGVTVSLDLSAAFVVVGSSTQVLPPLNSAPEQVVNLRPELVLGGSTFTALTTSKNTHGSSRNNQGDPTKPPQQQDESSQHGQGGEGPIFVISGQTLIPGGTPITVSGSTLSLAPSGSFLVVDGSTTTLATPAGVAVAHVTPPPLTIGNGVFRPLPGAGTTYQIGTALLTPGGSVVVAGTTIFLAAGATALVVNGVTTALSPRAQPIVTNPPVLTIGSHTYTALSETAFMIGGQTLTPGGTITVDGTTIILSPGATELVYGSFGRSTSTALFPATTTKGTVTTISPSASKGQSGQQAAATSTQGAASRGRSSIAKLLCAMSCLSWLLV